MAGTNPFAAWRHRVRGLMRFVAVCGLAAAATAGAFSARAEEANLPELIRIVVPFPPGGSNDIAARVVAEQLAGRIGRNVIVENRPGASGLLGARVVATGPRDGSMLLCTSSSLVTAAATKKSVPIDILKDLAPVSLLSESPLVIIVSADSKIRTPADLVNEARAHPDTITNGTPGPGTIAHLTGELLNEMAKAKLKHIPYTGGGPALLDLVAGRVDINIVSNSTSAGLGSQGKVRQIAITFAEPTAEFPGIPTMASVVPGFEVPQWNGIWAPQGTPPEVINRLNREINEIVKTPKFAVVLNNDGGKPLSLTPAESAERVKKSYQMWKSLAEARNLIAD